MPLNLIKSLAERDNHFNPHNATRDRPCKPLAKGALSPSRNKDLEPAAEELGSIWGYLKDDSPVYQAVERVITSSNTEAGGLVRSHLKRYWAMGAAQTHSSVLNSLRGFIEFRKVRSGAIYDWDLGSVLIFFEHRRSILL